MKKINPLTDYIEETDEEIEDGYREEKFPAFPRLFKGLIYASFIVSGMMLLFYCCK